MSHKMKLTLLAVGSVVAIALFLFVDLTGNWQYILERRFTRIIAIAVTGAVIAIATIIFQTITNNRILTPSLIGLDALYQLIQTVIIFFYGSTNVSATNQTLNYFLSIGLMIIFALILFKLLFKRGNNIYFLLLIGLIFGTFFQSLSTFMQVLIDPNEFLIVQNRMFASFNNVQTDLLYISIGIILITLLYLLRFTKYLDVLSLGKSHAVNLGVDYNRVVQQLMVIVAILMAVATALVGPIMFLGILVVNVTYEMFKTYKHSVLILATVFVSIIALVGGQFVIDRVFNFSTTLSVVINLVGGVYFLYLILKENRTW
ncbi:putative ABC transporter permease protein YclO [Halolactibacillus alkaliphilus]|uniref:Putative ABC transporter permease protein YclO n=1 Tax=Halolactibacillus alkaliphilus TaxID=442899 RepID=A0A511X355_9BACI|nr:iron chelate uptake ABC transporter family permease subunit [Halolactibacillus alkaliphilus]GEN57373.1 putative ABC transporter permease protein YclO [Halolactibacillus alkaliphilus]GGN73200.1 putative ABC transporter permease protein YclO [Halolactibacillus alkaliphilus]SFO94086.1 iron complex transport system permease protein [Halolactibacillus alkaliphilus]